MVALDTSAIIAILAGEPEQEAFRKIIASGGAKVGAPTLVETRLVLQSKAFHRSEALLRAFIGRESMIIVPFDTTMFEAAIDAFARFGKGNGHPAKLNLGDCLTYAVAKVHGLPLLFKGDDFVHTDIAPAYRPVP